MRSYISPALEIAPTRLNISSSPPKGVAGKLAEILLLLEVDISYSSDPCTNGENAATVSLGSKNLYSVERLDKYVRM